MNAPRTALLCLLLAPWLLAASPAAPAPDPGKIFEEAVQVLQIEVPVSVVGRDGEPVRGLGPESFVLLDEGREQEITDFDVVDLALESQEAAEHPELSAKLRRESLPSPARRHFLLFFDLSFSKPTSIVRARKAARDFVLDQLHPTDLAAVATYSLATGPQLILTFTPDRAQLARAIDTLGLHRRQVQAAHFDPLSFLIDPPEGLTETGGTDANLSEVREALEAAGTENMRVIGRQFDRSEKRFERSRVTAWSRSLADMARALNAVGGRKQIIYFSEGFDSRLVFGKGPLEDSLEDARTRQDQEIGAFWMRDSAEDFGHVGLQSDIEEMLEEFRRADCTIQSVDISGLRTEIEGPVNVGTDGLFYLANETGGELYEDANDLGHQLERLLERSSVTYLLSFQPDRPGESGSFHDVDVKLRGVPNRTRAFHRAGYYVPRPFEELHPFEKNLLASDAIASASPRSEIRLELLAAPFRAGHDRAYVPVILEIDGASLLAEQPGDRLTLEIYGYVTDAKGEMRDFFTQEVSILLGTGRDTMEDTGIKYYGHFELGLGEHLIRALVRNATTGRTGVVTQTLQIPAFSADPVVLPPFFVEAPKGWLLVRETRPESSPDTVVYPFTLNGEPYVPAARPTIASREDIRLCLVAYNLGQGDLELEGRVLGEDGAEVEGGRLALIERTVTGIRGLDKLEAVFRPRGLAAGPYTLEIRLTDPATGGFRTSTAPFLVASSGL